MKLSSKARVTDAILFIYNMHSTSKYTQVQLSPIEAILVSLETLNSCRNQYTCGSYNVLATQCDYKRHIYKCCKIL